MFRETIEGWHSGSIPLHTVASRLREARLKDNGHLISSIDIALRLVFRCKPALQSGPSEGDDYLLEIAKKGGFKVDAVLDLKACKGVEDGTNVIALFIIGLLYDLLADNGQEGVKYYYRAAQKGYAPSQATLGYMFYYGKGGLGKSVSEGINWYRLAADQVSNLGHEVLNLGHEVLNLVHEVLNLRLASIKFGTNLEYEGINN